MNKRLEATLKWCEEHKDKWGFKTYNSYNRENYNKYHKKYRKKNTKNILNDRMQHSINYTLRRSNIKRQGKNWKSFLSWQ